LNSNHKLFCISAIFFVSACFLITVSVGVAADRYGTAVEARSMLERAISAVKDNKEAALASFTAGVKGFKDRDLYVFCHGPDGLVSATGKDPKLIGRAARTIIDKNGTNLGDLFYGAAEVGKIKVVDYLWPRPGETKPAAKRSFITKVDGQICGVGYYK
jgi:signal transduction histidine kinase